jgi:hypothetical protein
VKGRHVGGCGGAGDGGVGRGGGLPRFASFHRMRLRIWRVVRFNIL